MMSALLRSVPSYSRLAICFVLLCVAGLYLLVLTGGASVAYAPFPPAATQADAIAGAPPLRKTASVLLVSSANKLVDLFERIGYRLDKVRRHGAVPRIYLTTLPGDLTELRPVADRKGVFIRAMLPLILRANERILADRARIAVLDSRVAAGGALSPDERTWLGRIARRYRAAEATPAVLLRHVDVIPPSLALAQSAEESGWGTSRFAREGNALYGQRIYRGSGGIVPAGREEGETHRVRTFDRLLDAVESYMRNLNSHPAYTALRAVRAQMRAENRTLDGSALAATLVRYSERGTAYVDTLRKLIRSNSLSIYDKVRFDERAPNLAIGGSDA